MAKKILVVDDSSTVRQQVRLALRPAGFDVIEATDGAEGLQAVRNATDLSLVICDVVMPRMTGIEMIEQLATDGNVVPILMLTTEAHPELIRKARLAGAKGWIVKPFNAELLIQAAHKLTA